MSNIKIINGRVWIDGEEVTGEHIDRSVHEVNVGRRNRVIVNGKAYTGLLGALIAFVAGLGTLLTLVVTFATIIAVFSSPLWIVWLITYLVLRHS